MMMFDLHIGRHAAVLCLHKANLPAQMDGVITVVYQPFC